MQIRSLITDSSKGKGRRKLASAAVLAGALMLSVAPMASAAPTTSGGDIESITISEQKAESAVEYWTPERMKAAKNADSLVAGKSGSAAKVEAGKPAKVAGHKADAAAAKKAQTKGGKTRATQESPVSHIGRSSSPSVALTTFAPATQWSQQMNQRSRPQDTA